jgi:hypothetical protein
MILVIRVEEQGETSEDFSGSWVITVCCLPGVRDY